MLFHNLPPPPLAFLGGKKTHQKRGKIHHNIIIGYTLNNFTTHNTKMMEKVVISILKKKEIIGLSMWKPTLDKFFLKQFLFEKKEIIGLSLWKLTLGYGVYIGNMKVKIFKHIHSIHFTNWI